MIALRVVLIAGLGILASGCINSASVIRVKPDGSGTIEQTLLVNLAAVKGLMGGMGAAAGKEAASGPVLNEAEFKRTAERMGVRPVSLTPVKQGNFEGQKAIYAFDDISKIRVDQDPQVSGATSKFSSSGASTNPIRFGFSRTGGTSTLTITVDEKVASDASAKAQQAPSLDTIDPTMMQMLKTMFDGFHVVIDLEVDGKIVKTNADYVSGSKITLLEVDMAGVLASQDKLGALQSKIKPGVSLSELRPYLKDIQGVKVNHPTVTIEYR